MRELLDVPGIVDPAVPQDCEVLHTLGKKYVKWHGNVMQIRVSIAGTAGSCQGLSSIARMAGSYRVSIAPL
jgi:hypothetical protein